MSLPRERTLILALLLILASASWVILIWQSWTANGMGTGLTMGMGAVLFLAIWIVMMIAMMFPTALIFAEKCFPLGARIAQFAALALILYGALVIVVPAALPLSGAGMELS